MNEKAPRTVLTDDDVRHVANLARLALSDSEVVQAKEDLAAIFAHIECQQEVDTTGVDPLDHPTELLNHIRNDEVGVTLGQAQVLENAPAVQDVYFDVPKVLGDSS